MKSIKRTGTVKLPQYTNKLIFHIRNSDILDWVENICIKEEADKTFAKASASSKRYHPKISNGIGGLYHHTKLCILVAQKLIKLYYPMGKLNDTDIDVIYASLILHDLWKYKTEDGTTTEHTNSDHGWTAFLGIIDYLTDKDWQSEIAEAVRFHMSNWCHTEQECELVRYDDSLVNKIVMMADMIASEPKIIEYIEGGGE